MYGVLVGNELVVVNRSVFQIYGRMQAEERIASCSAGGRDRSVDKVAKSKRNGSKFIFHYTLLCTK